MQITSVVFIAATCSVIGFLMNLLLVFLEIKKINTNLENINKK